MRVKHTPEKGGHVNDIFCYEGHDVRVITASGDLWWVAKDVCEILGIQNTPQAITRLDEDDICQTDIIDTLGRKQKTYIVSEAGLYSLILRSDKPEAKAFKRWVTHEVIPSIRKTGSYSLQQQPQDEFAVMRGMIDALEAHRKKITFLETKVQTINTEISRIDSRVDLFGADTHYRTIRAFCNERNLKVSLRTAAAIGKRAAKLCRDRGVEIGTVADERHGTVKSYPVEVIEAAEKDVHEEKPVARKRTKATA